MRPKPDDRLNDCFGLFDPSAPIPGAPHEAFTFDADQARKSMRKLAELDPRFAWPGHYGPLTGDVQAELKLAAKN